MWNFVRNKNFEIANTSVNCQIRKLSNKQHKLYTIKFFYKITLQLYKVKFWILMYQLV